jgi:hypothetical protein
LISVPVPSSLPSSIASTSPSAVCEGRPRGRGRAPGLCPVRPQRDLERRARLSHGQAYRRQHRLEAPFIHPLRLVEYFGLQFGVFGPILFAVLLRASEIRHGSDPGKVLLLSFSLPVLALLCVQALISRAHGNWSATAFPAASILVTATMFELDWRILFGVSLGLHLAIAVMLAAALTFALQLPMFERLQFLSRVVGWRGVAENWSRSTMARS